MTHTNDGGAAFPRISGNCVQWIDTCAHPVTERCAQCDDAAMDKWRRENDLSGMSLRDYFAAKALAGMMMACASDPEVAWAVFRRAQDDGMDMPQRYALLAYQVADAMLAERAK